MTRDQKILIAAGALAVVLFAASVAVRNGSPGDGTLPAGGPVGGLARWLGAAADAERADLAADCFDPTGRLAVAGSCIVRVKPGGTGVRLVRLRPDRPVSVTARLPRTQRIATADVAAGDRASVAVDGDGVEITIGCPGGGTCVVVLGAGG